MPVLQAHHEAIVGELLGVDEIKLRCGSATDKIWGATTAHLVVRHDLSLPFWASTTGHVRGRWSG